MTNTSYAVKSQASQAQRVLHRLQQGPATSWQLQQLGICSHTARVSDLRKKGHEITWVKKRGIVTYTLEGRAVQLPAKPPESAVLALQRSETCNETICANQACRKAFEPDRKTQRFCSSKCRFEDWERQHPRTGFLFEREGATT